MNATPRDMVRSQLPRHPIADQIWNNKYRFVQDGEPIDDTIADTMARVATSLAEVEADSETWAPRFEEVLKDFSFLPAGRIISGTGTNRKVTLFNCFVMGTIPDDMAGIFEHLKEAALTMQQGGGIGYDFSTLRPKGAKVKGVGADASGPLTFMDVWDSMCRTIMSAGSRRGAMMATLRCDHPDIVDFIEAKQQPGRLRMFNLSVLVTDPFMEAVKNNGSWNLKFNDQIYQTVEARELWEKIMRATYAYAEPGVIFIDRINTRNNLHYCETISATNPCGEQPLPPYGACLLGSVNLAQLIEQPFTDRAALDIEKLENTVTCAVRMMDNVVDTSGFPIDAQRIEALGKRRIGLGVTGLADALIMCGLVYGSPAACDAVEGWLAHLQRFAYQTSIDLAREKGPFPLFVKDEFLAGQTVQELPSDIRDGIAEHGIRNALLTSIAPTGTISLFADNVSSGLEPVFAFTYNRTVLDTDGSRRDEEVSDYAYRLYRAMFGDEAPLTEAFVTAQTLAPEAHVATQAAAQRYIDSSISKTINLPEDIPFDDFKGVYQQAYETGCKGCTTYRPNDVTGAVLSVSEIKPETSDHPEAETGDATQQDVNQDNVHQLVAPLERDEELFGKTYKIHGNTVSPHAMYVTINNTIDDKGRLRPFEIFINTKNTAHFAWTVALTRMISAVFRRGGDVSFIAEELQAVFSPEGGYWAKLPTHDKPRYIPSEVAHVGGIIEHHMRLIGLIEPEEQQEMLPLAVGGEDISFEEVANPPLGTICPKCSQPSVVRSGGCDTCASCGDSKCG